MLVNMMILLYPVSALLRKIQQHPYAMHSKREALLSHASKEEEQIMHDSDGKKLLFKRITNP